MSNLGERGNMLPALQVPKEEEAPPKPEEPFKNENELFVSEKVVKSKKKTEPVNSVDEKVEINETKEPEVPIPKPRKKRKKAVVSEESRKRMEYGRKKGLETRRRNRELKRLRELQELQGKLGVPNKVEPTMKKAKEIIDKGVKNARVESKEQFIDPDRDFKQFASFMDRYEKMKRDRESQKPPLHEGARTRIKPAVRPQRPTYQQYYGINHPNPRVNNPRPASNQAYYPQNTTGRRPKMNKEPENPWLNYFS